MENSYYYIEISFTNGAVQGYKSKEQPKYNDLMECYVFATINGETVWVPQKNVLSFVWKFEDKNN